MLVVTFQPLRRAVGISRGHSLTTYVPVRPTNDFEGPRISYVGL